MTMHDAHSVLAKALTLSSGPLDGEPAPPIPDSATEDALARLSVTIGPDFTERCRRRWWKQHYLCEAGEIPRDRPSPYGTHDPACLNCGGLGFTTDLTHFEADHTPRLVPCPCRAPTSAITTMRDGQPAWSMLHLWKHATFEGSDTKRPGQRVGLDVASQFALDDETAFLVLTGDTQAGKTHMAACALNYLHDVKGRRVLFVSAAELMDRLRGSFNPNVGSGYDEMFERIRKIDVLGLDDLGTESQTEWVSEKMYLLIDERLRYRRKTLVTTNLPPTLLGRRVAGRLFLGAAHMRAVVGYDAPLERPSKWHQVEATEVVCHLCHQAPHDFTCDHAA